MDGIDKVPQDLASSVRDRLSAERPRSAQELAVEILGTRPHLQLIEQLQALQIRSPAMDAALRRIAEQSSELMRGRQPPAWVTAAQHIAQMENERREVYRKLLAQPESLASRFQRSLTSANLLIEAPWLKSIAEQARGLERSLKPWALQSESIALQAAASSRLAADLRDQALKHLEELQSRGKSWRVPETALESLGLLRGLREVIGEMTPASGDAKAGERLEALLKEHGVQGLPESEQDVAVGPATTAASREKAGFLDKPTEHWIAVLGLLLSLAFFFYQEWSSQQQQAKNDARDAQIKAAMEAQARDIQRLTILVEQALAHAASKANWVVRERGAIVRVSPQHGAPQIAQLQSGEQVRALGRHGKWILVEHCQPICNRGWVLKKYLARAPSASFDVGAAEDPNSTHLNP